MKKYVIIVVMLLLVLAGCGVGDGSFSQAEYQIEFLSQDGKPIEGVKLEVQDEQGNIRYGYPVTDYYTGSTPTSDENGVIIFHHVRYFAEWGGGFFFGLSCGSSMPEFDCIFTRNGEILHSVKYGDLDREVKKDRPIIIREVSIYDKQSTEFAWKDNDPNYPIHIVEETLEFPIVEQKIIVDINE